MPIMLETASHHKPAEFTTTGEIYNRSGSQLPNATDAQKAKAMRDADIVDVRHISTKNNLADIMTNVCHMSFHALENPDYNFILQSLSHSKISTQADLIEHNDFYLYN